MKTFLLLSLFALVLSADAKTVLKVEWTDILYRGSEGAAPHAQLGLRSDGIVVWRQPK